MNPYDPSDRVWGCFLLGAMGDALGESVEFQSGPEIAKKIDLLEPTAITDDTQMTLFVAEGLVEANANRATGDARIRHVADALYRWYGTQHSEAHDELLIGRLGLAQKPILHHRRAPGNTCLSALRAYKRSDSLVAKNDSKGCGGLIRVAPVACVATSTQEAFQLGKDTTAITHGHPAGQMAAGFGAALIQGLVRGRTLHTSIYDARRTLNVQSNDTGLTDSSVLSALRASEKPASREALETLGGGWVAEECLAIALYCAIAAEKWVFGGDPTRVASEKALRLAVAHSGDSDSTAAVTGNILGALWGEEATPDGWYAVLGKEIELVENVAVEISAVRRMVCPI